MKLYNYAGKNETIRERIERIIQEMGIPQEELSTDEEMLDAIGKMPDYHYEILGIDRSNLEL